MLSRWTNRAFNVLQERVKSAHGLERLNSCVTPFLPDPLPLTESARPLAEHLGREGFVMLPPALSVAELSELRSQLEQRRCFDPWRPEIGSFDRHSVPEATNNAHITGVHELPLARRVANHPLVLSIVSSYLRCRPTIDDILAWWSLPGRPAPVQEQFFHRDRDAVRFLKLFVYLSDVTERDGAHVFVEASHRAHELLQRRKRYPDEDVERVFSRSRIRSMVGSAGTIFLEDTFGLHKGALPTGSATRLLLQVRYTSISSNFARQSAGTPVDALFDSYINRRIY